MLYRGDDFTAEGESLFIYAGNHDFHITWFGDELSGTTVTDTTISFTAPTTTDTNSGIGGTISDSNNGLAGLTAGAEITISGTVKNNYKYIIRSVAAGTVTVRWTGREIMTEAAGTSVTLTEHTKRPEVNHIVFGSKTEGNAGVDISDAQLATAAGVFGTDGWSKNAYFDGLRISYFKSGPSYQHVMLHNLDMDHEDTASTGTLISGLIECSIGGHAWTNYTVLDPASTPFAKGMTVSECVVIGSTAQISADTWPGGNIVAVASAGETWMSIIGCTARTAREHNFRIQGFCHLHLHDSDFLGQHIGGSGNKARVTIRGSGANKVGNGDFTGLYRDVYTTDNTDVTLRPSSIYGTAQYIYDSGSSEGESIWSAIESTGNSIFELKEDCIFHKWVFDPDATLAPNVQLAAKGTQHMCFTDNWYIPGTAQTQDSNSTQTLDDGPDNDITDGVKSTTLNYLGPVYIDEQEQSLYNLPTPGPAVIRGLSDQMKIGTNFVDMDFTAGATADFVGVGTDWATTTNPWNAEFVKEIKWYDHLRFMKWGKVNGSTEVDWVDRTLPTSSSNEVTMAYEWMIDLCNRTGTDPWICVPLKVTDGYITQLATLLDTNLNANRKIRLELSNEVWSNSNLHASYVNTEGLNLGLDAAAYLAGYKYYVLRSLEMFAIFETIFGADSPRIVKTLSGWASDTEACTTHLAALGNATINPTNMSIDAYAIAPYFGTSVDGGAVDPIQDLTDAIPAAITHTSNHYALTSAAGIDLICYEGGQQIFNNDANIPNDDPGIYGVYQTYLDGLAPYVTVYSNFVHNAKHDAVSAWGAETDVSQGIDDAHKLRAMKDWVGNTNRLLEQVTTE